MNKLINYNQNIREHILNYFNEIFEILGTETDSINIVSNFIIKLKSENISLYETIIKSIFYDEYLLLKYRDVHNQLTEDEKLILKQYESIIDVEELLYIIEKNNNLINSFVFSSLKFNALNKVGKSFHLNSADEKHMLIFSPLTFLEKESYIQDTTSKNLIKEYNNYIIENQYFPKEIIKKEATNQFTQEIIIRAEGNIKNFEAIILEMLIDVYIWKNKLKETNSKYITDNDIFLIDIVENENIENIIQIFIHNNEILAFLIKEYIYFSTVKKDFLQNQSESYNNLDEKIKKKTKKSITI